MTTTLSQATLLAAIAHFEEEKRRIDVHISECRQQLKAAINEVDNPGKPALGDMARRNAMWNRLPKELVAAEKRCLLGSQHRSILVPVTTTLSQATLLAAIAHFEEEKRRIDVHISECRQQLKAAINEVDNPGKPALVPATPKKRTMSAAARKAIAAAQKKRWAEHNNAKKEAPPAVPEAVSKPKRKISAATRKKMADAQRKRFAAEKTMTAGAGA